MNKLLAPNGKPSNLTPEQYKLVRSKEFISWFGDWENDPENASKVVDSNGEPLVVYHGTAKKFNIFKKINQKFDNENYVSGMWFFAPPIGKSLNEKDREYFYDEDSAIYMAENWVENAFVKKCFLKVINPIEVNDYDTFLTDVKFGYMEEAIKKGKTDGYIIHGSLTDGGVYRDDVNVFNSNQIKLADGTNTTFDGSNPDIRFDNGGEVEELKFSNKIESDAMGYDIGDYLYHITPISNFNNIINKGFVPKDGISVNNKRFKNRLYFATSLISAYDLSVNFGSYRDDKEYIIFKIKSDCIKNYEEDSLFEHGIYIDYKLSNKCIIGYVNSNELFNKFDDEDIDNLYSKGGSILLAPNGKPSNLTPEQYKLVRSSAFKKWFGDWENDPANASKVVDENGEPLPVYHGTFREFNVFEWSKDGGFYFTEFSRIAEIYATSVQEGKLTKTPNENPIVLKCFLNFKNPLRERIYGVVGKNKRLINIAIKKGYDSLIISGGQDVGGYYDQYVAFEPNQIKLADGTNNTFDGSNPDIRFDEGGEIDGFAQQLIDIISSNPQLEKYQKYKVILKDKFGIDFDSIYKDQEYIDNANINDIKKQDDFFDFGNWLKYAKIISKKRGFIPMNLYDVPSDKYKLTDEIWNETSKNLNFNVKKIPYIERGTGSGDIARAFGDTIYYTDHADFYYFLHELGHIYDFQNNIKGIIKNPAYSPTNYGTNNSGETFAENFAIYFINPMALKNWNEEVYNALDSQINTKYKNEISRIMPNNNNITFNNGGEVNTGLFSQIWGWFGIKF